MPRLNFIPFSLLLGISLGFAQSTAPENAELYFISPTDGATLSNPVVIRFGLNHMGIAPAGTEKANTGHHHLIMDSDLPPLDQAVPNDDHHRHFGKGQTETRLDFSPGQHTLQLLLGDFRHIPHTPPVISRQITITVQ